jgi:hypothetical protein
MHLLDGVCYLLLAGALIAFTAENVPRFDRPMIKDVGVTTMKTTPGLAGTGSEAKPPAIRGEPKAVRVLSCTEANDGCRPQTDRNKAPVPDDLLWIPGDHYFDGVIDPSNLVIGVQAAAETPNRIVVVTGSMGGRLVGAYEAVRLALKLGVRFRIEGDCYSACVLLLAVPGTCVDGTVASHSAHDGRGNMMPEATDFMRKLYPPKLDDEFIRLSAYHKLAMTYIRPEHPWLQSSDFIPRCTTIVPARARRNQAQDHQYTQLGLGVTAKGRPKPPLCRALPAHQSIYQRSQLLG